ncbi:MAG: RIP metalloprotease RseP [Bacilli bacterium]
MKTLLYFILILGVIVLIHEFGHFIFAKLFKIYVHEFAIGMGPKLLHYKKKGGETEYSLRLIPIGGFCALAGEEVEEDTSLPKDRKLQGKPAWQRFLVMFFGAGFNFILAVILLFMIAVIWGAPTTTPKLSSIEIGKPADLAGLQVGDTITKINSHKTSTIDDVSIYLQLADKSKPIIFEVKTNTGDIKKISVNPIKEEINGNTVYRIGVGLAGEIHHTFGSILNYTVVKTGSLFKQMFITLGGLFKGDIGIKQLSGPVGIYNIVGEQAKGGLENIIYLIALLSINVGFINLLPLPAFDGGRILFLIIEKIKGSPVKPATENMIHSIGFFLIIALMLYITFNDILRLF